MAYRIFTGICLILGGLILSMCVFESVNLPLLQTLIYGLLSIVLIALGFLLLIWDTSADELHF